MKKIISIITAVSLVAASMLSAVTVSAAEKITADKVKEMIYSTGLNSYPEWTSTVIKETGKEEDVLNPEKRTVKDVIDINRSYRQFFVKNSSGKYVINNDDNIAFIFKGLNDDNQRVQVSVFPQNYVISASAGTAQYSGILPSDKGLEENYSKIAEIINASDIANVKDIKIVMSSNEFFRGSCVYIKDSSNNEYVIPTTDNIDEHIEAGKMMSFNDWCSAAEKYGNGNANTDDDADEMVPAETINGDEIRDTDIRAAYIGTESKFADVSGDLVSYVNELNDLGIINGYDENMFMPDNTITRAEAAAMLARMLKYTGNYNGKFADVSANDWFAGDVAALTSAGVINGYDENTFAPHNDIKYQEVMKILVFTLGYMTKYDTVFDNFYPQQTNQKAMEIGLTDGLGSFDTTAAITRGDMAIMLSNALDTHMFTTVKLVSPDGMTGGGMSQQDITLIDYLNGKKLNGTIPKAYFD